MVGLSLQPESDFSRSVFKVIRPHIPRERWPVDSVRARFEAGDSGLWLNADFDDFPNAYAELAGRLVREAGVELVIKSPLARAAAAVVRARRWRDAALYAFLPLMFAIPLMAALSDLSMRVALILFCGDLLILLASQAVLASRRAQMRDLRFIAHIPAPGLKINLAGKRMDSRFGESMPEV